MPGESLTYTISVANNGPSDVTGATVADLLPAAIISDTFKVAASGGASDSTHAAGNNVYSGNIIESVNLAAGATLTYTVTASISSSATGSLSNTATVAAPNDVTNSNPSAVRGVTSVTDTDTLSPQVDLVITKTDDASGHAVPGESLTYTITLTNTGPSDATNVVVNDLPPATFTNVTSPNPPAGVSYNSLTGVFTIGTLAAGAGETLELSGTVSSSATGTLTNTAIASASDATNVSATDTDVLEPQAALVISKTDDANGHAVPGESLTYTITLTNDGPSDATGVVVNDLPPATFTNVTTPNIPAGVSYNSLTGVFAIGTLAAGARRDPGAFRHG